MIRRFLESKIETILGKKSVLLLGPRQTGKSTLLQSLRPDLSINFAHEDVYHDHLKNPSLLALKTRALPERARKIVLLDEIQRIPSILNTVQALQDEDKNLRFLLSGSSARKLSRGRANLLPGRILFEKLYPLTYAEIVNSGLEFDLERSLKVGLLPEIYLEKEIGAGILSSYAEIYLREEIQAEALVKDVGAYARFLDLSAELSGQFINYAKLASDSEINKDTIRNYFDILEETLLIHRIPVFDRVASARKARQKDKFYFFDIGVRNALLKKLNSHFTDTEKGPLFEHLVFQNLKAMLDYRKSDFEIKTYRDDRNLEVDFILENSSDLILIEVKYQKKFRNDFDDNLDEFSSIVKTKKKIRKFVVYAGKDALQTPGKTSVLPLSEFLGRLNEVC